LRLVAGTEACTTDKRAIVISTYHYNIARAVKSCTTSRMLVATLKSFAKYAVEMMNF
jgi:hypothetical protein